MLFEGNHLHFFFWQIKKKKGNKVIRLNWKSAIP